MQRQHGNFHNYFHCSTDFQYLSTPAFSASVRRLQVIKWTGKWVKCHLSFISFILENTCVQVISPLFCRSFNIHYFHIMSSWVRSTDQGSLKYLTWLHGAAASPAKEGQTKHLITSLQQSQLDGRLKGAQWTIAMGLCVNYLTGLLLF